MAFDLSSISTEIIYRPPRIILTGSEKCGKSTFASQFPNAVFMPIIQEEGIDGIHVPKFPTICSYDEFIEALGALCSQEHEYEYVVIDSASALEPLIWQHVCRKNGADSIEKVGGGFGKGYVEALSAWGEIQDALDWLRNNKNCGTIIISHTVIRQAVDPLTESYDTYEIDINKKAAAKLVRWADCVLFANKKTIIKTEDAGFGAERKRAIGTDEFKLYTQKRPAHPGGGRDVYGKLPYEMNLDYNKFAEAVEKARNAN